MGLVGSVIIAFIMSPFLVHTLGDTKYGIWSIIAALTGYMTLMDLGVSSAIAKYVSKYKSLNDYRSINVIVASGLTILIAVAIVLITLSPFIADLIVGTFKLEPEFQETVRKLVIIGAFDVSLFIGSGVLFGSLFGFQRYEIVNAAMLGSGIVRAIGVYLALSSGFDLLAMGVISLVSKLLSALFMYVTMRKLEPEVEITPKNADRKTVSYIFKYSKFTFLTTLSMQLIYYTDAFVIGYFMSAAAITIYTIPWSLSDYTNKVIMAVSHTFVPVFSAQDAKKQNDELYQTYVTGTKVVLLISNLLCIGVLVLGDNFIHIWMGAKYAEECSTILAIMFFTQMIKSPQLLSYSIMLGTANHQKFGMYNMVFAIANLILSIHLVQKYGLVGVAGATAITQILFYTVVTPILTSSVIKYSILDYFKSTYLRIVPASIVLFAVMSYFGKYHSPTGYLSLLSEALIGAVLYLTVAYFTLLDSSEREAAHQKFSQLIAKIA